MYLSLNSIVENEVSLACLVAICLVGRDSSLEKATLNLLSFKTQL